MFTVPRIMYWSSAFMVLSCSIAAAQKNPTFSLEATAINDVEFSGPPTMHVSAAPGDTITFKVFVRDWSPDGEELRAFQAQIDTDGFESGLSGQIKPVDYDETTGNQDENRKNCFVDRNEPTYVLRVGEDFAIADTRSPGYRWLGILLHEDQGVVSKQDGKKHYCGTVRMKVSDDAQGSFKVRLLPGRGSTTIRDKVGGAILPVDIEDTIVDVAKNTLRVIASDPPNGAIDARAPLSNAAGGWKLVSLTFNGDTAALSASDFTVDDGSTAPPKIIGFEPKGSVLEITLNRPVTSGRWTSILHRRSSTGVRLGSLRGDVNNDGRLALDDLFELVYLPSGDETPVYRVDVNHDDRRSIADALRVLDVLTIPGAYRTASLEP